MNEKHNGAKCGGAMQGGFVIDHGDMQYKQQQIWVEGNPESSFWSGLKTSGRAAFNVRALRCGGCRFLEFYADDKTDLGGEFSRLFTN